MATVTPYRLDPIALSAPVTLYDGSGNAIVVVAAATGYLTVCAAAGRVGFFGATPAAKPTGVAVDAAGIHAALVTLGLIGV